MLRELMLGPRRFSDLRADLPGISANVLTQRLAGLEESAILIRRKLPPPAASQVYELTPWGYEAEPIFIALGRWATRSPQHDPTLPLSAVSLMLSLRTLFEPDLAAGIDARIGLHIAGQEYRAEIAGGGITVARAPAQGCDLLFTAEAVAPVAAAIHGGVAIGRLEQDGALAVTGDRALAERFVRLFPLPAKVGAEAAAA